MVTIDPILITGCARSGTSLIGGIINICGAWGGEMSGPNKNNKKGMFENAEIRNIVVKPYLRDVLKVDPMGQNPLPDINKLKAIHLKEQVISIILRQKYSSGPWFYKGAKMCLIWPLWHKDFPNAKWVIVRRRTEGIVNSCLRTTFMRAYSDEKGWKIWVDEHLKRFKEMKLNGLDVIEIWPEWFIKEGNYKPLEKMINYLGLEWKEKEVKEFVSPNLWEGKK